MDEMQNTALNESTDTIGESEVENTPKKPKRPAGKTKKGKKRPTGKTNQKPIKKKRKKKEGDGPWAQILAVLVVLLAFYLVFSLFIGGLILYSFNDTAENTEIYSLNVVYDERILHKVDAETANTEYGLYISFEHLSEIASFGLAGDGDNATLFIIGSDNRIECTKNSSLVTINGNAIRMASPILYKDNDYLIPISMIENFITGLSVSYNDEKMICSITADVGKSDISLKLKLPEEHPFPDYFTDEDRYYNTESKAN